MPHGGAIDINFIQKAYHGVHKIDVNKYCLPFVLCEKYLLL